MKVTKIVPYEPITLVELNKAEFSQRMSFQNESSLVIGGSGSGKTRYFKKPNLMPRWLNSKKG